MNYGFDSDDDEGAVKSDSDNEDFRPTNVDDGAGTGGAALSDVEMSDEDSPVKPPKKRPAAKWVLYIALNLPSLIFAL